MPNDTTIFLTGATGLLGSEILSRILGMSSQPRVLVLLRGDSAEVKKKLQSLVNNPLYGDWKGRVEPVAGDLLHPALGLAPRTRAQLTERITHVIHAAAAIDFDLPYAAAHEINYLGTQRVYELAADAKQLKAFAHVSTAYVAGRRTGLITEDELDHAFGFVNTYEHTKYESEQFLRARMSSMPIAIYRTTTMIGNSVTGAVRQFNYFHLALRAMYLNQVPFVPGDPEYCIDVIPHDWAAEVIRFLALEKFLAGETYHICSGVEHSFSLRELIDATLSVFASASGAKRRAFAAPTILPPAEFQSLVERTAGPGNPSQLPKSFNYFIAELALPKLFDSEHLNRDLHPASVPDIRTYYSKVVEYCLEKQWGRANRGQSVSRTAQPIWE